MSSGSKFLKSGGEGRNQVFFSNVRICKTFLYGLQMQVDDIIGKSFKNLPE